MGKEDGQYFLNLQAGKESKKGSCEGPSNIHNLIKNKRSRKLTLEQEHVCVDLKSNDLTLSTGNPTYLTMT